MPKKIDLTCKKFGKLTVVKENKERIKGAVYWICKCDCGNTKIVRGADLKNGNTTSCGMCKSTEIIGQTFNYLTVLEKSHKDTNGTFVYKCLCKCGNIAYARGSQLKSGNVKSCGCYLNEIKQTKEYKSKISKANGGNNNGMYGKIGKLNSQWNPNRTHDQRVKERKTLECSRWRKSVFEKDECTCQCCGDNKGHNLIAHHLDSYDTHSECRQDVSNGITLCETCHKEFHHLYGYGHNTKEQYKQFIKYKKSKNQNEIQLALII